MSITNHSRYTRSNPCPVCGGHPMLPRGKGLRCTGYSTDPAWAFCSREEYGAGLAPVDTAAEPLFRHRLDAPCKCGRLHYSGAVVPLPASPEPPRDFNDRKPRIVATYDYRDAKGKLLYQVVRYLPKEFRQRRPARPGESHFEGWVWNLQGVEKTLYHLPEVIRAGFRIPAFLVEGEKDADNLTRLGLLATTAGSCGSWRREFAEILSMREVVIIPDHDQQGYKYAEAARADLLAEGGNVRLVKLPGMGLHEDVSDWLAQGHTKEELLELVANTELEEGHLPPPPSSPAGAGRLLEPEEVNLTPLPPFPNRKGENGQEQEPESPLPVRGGVGGEVNSALSPQSSVLSTAVPRLPPYLKVYNARDLLQMELPERRFAVPGILPEGLALLCGSPKVGKSWMALNIGIAIATGGNLFGKVEVEKGRVWYLALEDNERRLKDRVSQLAAEGVDLSLLDFTHDTKARIGEMLNEVPLEQMLLDYLQVYPDTKLIMIDTLQKVRQAKAMGQGVYESDYNTLAPLHKLAKEQHVSLLVIHHLRKAGAEDPFEQISGSQGLMGAADTGMILKRGRGQDEATLTLTGRDVGEQELVLKLDKGTGIWSLLANDAEQYALSKAHKEILDLLGEHEEGLSPLQISDYLDIERDAIRKRLSRMNREGLINRLPGGKYAAPF